MKDNRSVKLALVAGLWLILLAVGVLVFKFLNQRSTSELQSEFESVAAEAREVGAQVPSLPKSASEKDLQTAIAETRSNIEQTRELASLKDKLQHVIAEARSAGLTPPEPAANLDRAGLLAFIQEWEQQVARLPPMKTLGLGLDSFSGYAVFRAPAFAAALNKHRLRVEITDDAANYATRMQNLQSGKTPLAVFTLDALLAGCAEIGSLPGAVVMVIDETRGADALVAYKSAVANLDALNQPDVRIVLTPDSPSEMLVRIVQSHFQSDRQSADAWVTADGAADVFKRLKQADPKTPRAFALWEPYVSLALQQPDVHVLLDSGRFDGFIVDVLVVNRTFLEQSENQTSLDEFLRAYFTVLRAAEQESGMKKLVMADAQLAQESLTDTQAIRLTEGIAWKNTAENYAYFGILQADQAQQIRPLAHAVRQITGVLMKTGALATDPTGDQPEHLFDDRLLRQMYRDDFRPGDGPAEKIRPAAALAPLNEENRAKLLPVGTLRVDAISFRRASAELTPGSRQELLTLAETLRSFPRYYLQVQGNARPEGNPEANRKLAEQRALAAATFLAEAGISADRIHAQAAQNAVAGGQAQSVSFILMQLPP